MEGPISPTELVGILQRTVEEQGSAFRSSKVKQAEAIIADRRLREEQDAAYLAALQLDKVCLCLYIWYMQCFRSKTLSSEAESWQWTNILAHFCRKRRSKKIYLQQTELRNQQKLLPKQKMRDFKTTLPNNSMEKPKRLLVQEKLNTRRLQIGGRILRLLHRYDFGAKNITFWVFF